MRIAILSDIHEDYESLKKILEKIQSNGYDQLVCLGDISGFSLTFYRYRKSRNASACLDLVREKCDIILPGNHDYHAAHRIPEHSAIFDFPNNWYDLEPEKQSELSNNKLWLHEDDFDTEYSGEEIEFLLNLPEYAILNTPYYKIMLSHYAFPNLSGFRKKFYTWEKDFKSHFDFMQNHDCTLSFIGHAHSRGFYKVTPDHFRHYSYRRIQLEEIPTIIGIPPVTRHKNRRGFCIFDTDSRMVRAVK